MKIIFYIILSLMPFWGFSQNYTSYFTGNQTDIVTKPSGGICLMGGATEDDNAMKWFLQRANGGDVLILRASGSDGYNRYLYSSLGVHVNSVESIVCNNASSGNDPYILQKIRQAEAIWFAGGDQWKYVSYWRNTPLDSTINQSILQRNIVIGGTSAGMAILGKYYFSAKKGTVTSNTALSNPYNSLVTVDSTSFLNISVLNNIITDTHFDNPNRKGRLVTFLARIYTDYGVFAKAIACDEYTAVCVDTDGIARVFGEFPEKDENAYFIQSNCESSVKSPENCISDLPLTWNNNGQALKVYQIKGDRTGSKYFDLNTWQLGNGGTWLNWSVLNGVFFEQNGSALNCLPTAIDKYLLKPDIVVYPNLATHKITISGKNINLNDCQVFMYNYQGQKLNVPITKSSQNMVEMNISHFENGVFYLVILNMNIEILKKVIIKI